MAKRCLLVANWKMNLTAVDSARLATELSSASGRYSLSEMWLAPSFTAISAVREALGSSSKIAIGGQNVHWSESGAFTGEISANMLLEFGATFAITGHSERRHILGESDAMVVDRSMQALRAGLSCIYCVGETLEQRERGETLAVLSRQLESLFAVLDTSSSERVIIAYEPVWAIGTGKVAGLDDIDGAHNFISKSWSKKFSPTPRILYGGSVTPDNFKAIAAHPLVSGALVGGASLSAEKFLALASIVEQAG